MELNDFISKFANLFEETDPATITADTVYSQLEEWDSVMVLSLISMIDEEFGVALTGNEMKSAVTIQDLFNTVQARLA